MQISIRYKLFLSILAATCGAILCMLLITVWSINLGFTRYLEAIEKGRLEKAAQNLSQIYKTYGNWDFFRENPWGWTNWLLNAQSEYGPHLHQLSLPGPHLPPTPMGPYPPPRLMGPRPPRWPFIILDAEKRPFIKIPIEARGMILKPILHQNKIVGYVGGFPPKPFLNPYQLAFLRQQKLALILSALGMVLAVMLFSLPLAGRLLRPIRTMAAATHDLASGKYSTRIPVRSSDELGKLAGDFNAMALSLEKNEKARRQWVADISHELRTPLTVLRGEIEALLEGIRVINREAIRSLYTETLRLNRLVDDLYQLALSDLGTLTYHKENLDPVLILEESLGSFKAEFLRKHIRIRTDFTRGRGTKIFADSERLHQLFTNLLDNSLKYTDPEGELNIRVESQDLQVLIELEDSLPGVVEDEINRLFDRLYRVEGSRNRASGGAGLGLAICKNIVEAHGGTMSAHPSRLGGVLIRILFPVLGDEG